MSTASYGSIGVATCAFKRAVNLLWIPRLRTLSHFFPTRARFNFEPSASSPANIQTINPFGEHSLQVKLLEFIKESLTSPTT